MKKILLVMAIIVMSCMAYAADKSAEVRESIGRSFSNMPVNDVRESEIKGLYEVETGGNIIYSDGNYLMMGHLFDFAGKDITQEKINGLMAKKAAELDKSLAVRIGNGKKEVIEFTDPECPYCLKAEEFFRGADVTRLVYFMPLPFHKNAERLSVHVLCSASPAAEYQKVLNEVSASNADNFKTITCEAGKERLGRMMNAAQNLGVRGTPFFVIDGKAVSGADPVIQQMIK